MANRCENEPNHSSVKYCDVLLEGLNYPDIPSTEAYMPNMLEAWDRTATNRNVDLNKECEVLRHDLTFYFNK